MLLLLVKYRETIIIKNSNKKKSENTKGTTTKVLCRYLIEIKIALIRRN